MPTGALTGCGSHTATAVPDEARGYLYIYNGGSSGTCQGIDIFKIKISDPADAVTSAPRRASRQCHDNTVLLNGANSYASCAGGNGISMFKFDMTIDADRRGRRREPDAAVVEQVPTVSIGHSAAFSYDGKTVVFGWEPGGGTSAAVPGERPDPRPHAVLHGHRRPAPSAARRCCTRASRPSLENCTWHNFNTVPTKGGNYPGLRQLPGRHHRHRLHEPGGPAGDRVRRPERRCRRTTHGGGDPDGGDWSTYWYNGKIYESDIYRGMMVWDLDNTYTTARTRSTIVEPADADRR